MRIGRNDRHGRHYRHKVGGRGLQVEAKWAEGNIKENLVRITIKQQGIR